MEDNGRMKFPIQPPEQNEGDYNGYRLHQSYKESDVLEFISRNMEEVVQDGEKVLKMKEEAKRKPDKAKRKGGGKRVAVHR